MTISKQGRMGYPIDQLAESSSFPEVAYLLICGDLPTSEQLADFAAGIHRAHGAAGGDARLFDGFPRDAHPIAVLSLAALAALADKPRCQGAHAE